MSTAQQSATGVTSGASIVSGGLWSVLGRILPQLQLLILSVVVARFLGPDGMGRQSLIAFVGLTAVLLATAGFPSSVARFVGELLGARQGGVVLGLYVWTWRFETVAAVVAGGGVALNALLGGDPALAWVLAGAGSALAVLQSVPQALLSGAQRWREATIVGVVTGIAAVPATIAVLAAGGGISSIFAVELVVIAVNLGWTAHLARRFHRGLPPREPIAPELRRRFLSFAGMTTITVLTQFVVWTRSELFVLDRVSTDKQIALYSISFAIVSGLAQVPEAIGRVAMPAVATLVGAGELHRVRSGYWRATRLLLFLTVPVLAGALTTGPALVRLVYGSAYAGAESVLRVMLAPLLLVPLFSTAGALLYALGRLRFLVVVELVATAVNIGLAILLIPELDATGAAIANMAAQLTAGIPFLVLAGRLNAPVAVAFAPLARCVVLGLCIAGAAGATLLALGGGAGALAAVLAGLAAFAVLGPLLRPLGHDDAAWLTAALDGESSTRRRVVRAIWSFAPAAR
jgi:O-antigen/teichoic acid export membrane protein